MYVCIMYKYFEICIHTKIYSMNENVIIHVIIIEKLC